MKIPSNDDASLVTWKVKNKSLSSENALKEMNLIYSKDIDQTIKSEIVEEKNNGLEYHVIVEVAYDKETPVSILKTIATK